MLARFISKTVLGKILPIVALLSLSTLSLNAVEYIQNTTYSGTNNYIFRTVPIEVAPNVTVPSGAYVEMRTSDTITLHDGFTAVEGSTFIARPTQTVISANRTVMYVGETVILSATGWAPGNMENLDIYQLSPNAGYYGDVNTGTGVPPDGDRYDDHDDLNNDTRFLALTISTPGTYVFRATIWDSSAFHYGPSTATVTVIEPSSKITASATSVTAGQTVTLTATASAINVDHFNIFQTSPNAGHYGAVSTGTHIPPNGTSYTPLSRTNPTRSITLTMGSTGSYTFRGGVYYGGNWYYGPETVTVTVAGPSSTITASRTAIRAGETVTLIAEGTGNNLQYFNIDRTAPSSGYYGPIDVGTEAPPSSGNYQVVGGPKVSRQLILTFNNPGTYTFRGTLYDGSNWHNGPGTATVTVTNAAPVIAGQPTTQAVPEHADAQFTVIATGVPAPTYQWRRGTTNLSNGAAYAGATSPTLTVKDVVSGDTGSDYNAVVTNSEGSATSSNAALSISGASNDPSNTNALNIHLPTL